jgi:hypothetical protein
MGSPSCESLQRALCWIKVPLSPAEDFVPEIMPERTKGSAIVCHQASIH